jgi:hypothetical protein
MDRDWPTEDDFMRVEDGYLHPQSGRKYRVENGYVIGHTFGTHDPDCNEVALQDLVEAMTKRDFGSNREPGWRDCQD